MGYYIHFIRKKEKLLDGFRKIFGEDNGFSGECRNILLGNFIFF